MEVMVPSAGSYVVAVSGGVDSVVLLDLLASHPELSLVVAHFDHGIRPDSRQDRHLVQKLADHYASPFEYAEGRLGPGASEATARQARYKFLREIQENHGCAAIITAHHQDDVLETAIINMMRGSGRRGLTALIDRPGLRRPLLNVPKADIQQYAAKHGLSWREDVTNNDETYLRNYVRRKLIPQFTLANRQQFLQLLSKLSEINKELDNQLDQQLERQDSEQLDRSWFSCLPHKVALEIMASWLRANGLNHYDKKLLERTVLAAKSAQPGKRIDIYNGTILRISQDKLGLEQPGVLANTARHV